VKKSKSAAYHEAGHSVVHYLLGFTLGPVGIRSTGGFSRATRVPGFHPRVNAAIKDNVDATIVGCLAGFEAENILRGRDFDYDDAADLDDLYRCFKDFAEAKQLITSIPGGTWDELGPSYYKVAGALLRTYWPAVVALATEIRKAERRKLALTGPRATAVISGAIGRQLGGQTA
jgi:hypothetical protein